MRLVFSIASFPGLQSQLTLVKLLRRMMSGGRLEDFWRCGTSVKQSSLCVLQ